MIHQVRERESRRVSAADWATWALGEELHTWPKPGLVSPHDRGAHDDMDAALFEASIAALADYFAEIYEAGRDGAAMSGLRGLGIAAERHMMIATGGINTHRGAIFSLGLLLAAAGRREVDTSLTQESLGTIVRATWGPDIARVAASDGDSHGLSVVRRHGVAGARGEAARGFPHIYDVGWPALRGAGGRMERGQSAVLFGHCGRARRHESSLPRWDGWTGICPPRARDFLAAGGVLTPNGLRRAADMHREFVARRLSPGGAGDLLAATLLVDALEAAGRSEC